MNEALLRLGRLLQESGYGFVTGTPASHGRVNARPGSGWARSVRDVFGWSRPFAAGVLPAEMLEALREAGMAAAVPGGFRSLVRFSTLDGMLFAHSAYPTDGADAVFFGPDTYRYAQAIRQGMPEGVRRAVDIGCGAGPGALVVAKAAPGAAVTGVDINEAALAMTRVNAALAGLAVDAVRSDLLGGVEGSFDLVVANPPYLVDAGERAYRHGGGALGEALSLKILDAAIDRLAPGGTLLLYTGVAIVEGEDPFLQESRSRLAGRGMRWTYRELDPDVFGEELEQGVYAVAERIAAVLLTATKT